MVMIIIINIKCTPENEKNSKVFPPHFTYQLHGEEITENSKSFFFHSFSLFEAASY